jgi:hypothetical protein
MTLPVKIASSIGLVLLLLHTNPAYARDPRDVGDQSAMCVAAGGYFTVGDSHNEYECDYKDGSYQTCDFSDPEEPDCDTGFAEADIDPVDPFDFHKKH